MNSRIVSLAGLAFAIACSPGSKPDKAATPTAVVTGTTVTVTWGSMSNADYFDLYRQDSQARHPWNQGDGIGPGHIQGNGGGSPLMYNDAGVTPGHTYVYRVAAHSSGGYGPPSDESAPVTVPGGSSCTSPPAAPALNALAMDSTNKIVNLSWNAVTCATSYVPKRSNTPGGPYTNLASVSVTSASDNTVTAGNKYYYVVQAFDSANRSSANSNEQSITVPTPVTTPPPTNFTAAIDVSNVKINLGWTAVASATSYTVSRSTFQGSGYTPLTGLTAISATSGSDTTGSPGSCYYYVVTAAAPTGTSANSSEAFGCTGTAAAPPPPAGLTATLDPPTYNVKLSWSASTGATSYSVRRSNTQTGAYSPILNVNGTSAIDASISLGATYFYAVVANGPGGASGYSFIAGATLTIPTVPPPPANFTATVNFTTNQVALSWSASLGATGYSIGRGTASGGPYPPVTLPISGTSATDTGVSPGSRFFYTVIATNAAGPSTPSAEAIAIVPGGAGAPPAPTGVAATVDASNHVSLNWPAVTGATSYAVLRSTTTGSGYVVINGNVTVLPYVDADPKLTGGTPYYYVVIAINASGYSPKSNEATATPAPPPPAPATLTATLPAPQQVSLTWGASTGANSYAVKRATINGGPYTIVTGLGSVTTTSATDSSVATSTVYYYVVTATGQGGESVNSPQASITTGGAPQSPAGLTVSIDPTNGTVSISWGAAVNATSYTVSRSTTAGGPYSPAPAMSAISVTNVTDGTVERGVTYYYVVNATNASGTSANSAEQKIQVPTAGLAPAPPTGVKTSLNASNQVVVVWNASAGGPGVTVTYDVKRGTTTGGPYNTQVASGISALTTTDTSTGPGRFFYVVVSHGAGGTTSANSKEAIAQVPTTGAPPPVTVSAAVNPANNNVTLSWAAATGAASYKVYAATTSGAASPTELTLGTTLTATSFDHTNATASTVYYYSVSAVNTSGSTPSLEVRFKSPPANPGALTVAADGSGRCAGCVTVTWAAAARATAYTLKRTGGPSPYVPFIKRAAPTLSFTDTTALAGTAYTYTLYADNDETESLPGGTGSFTTAAGLTPSAAGADTGVLVHWGGISGAASYNVLRSTVSGSGYAQIGTSTNNWFLDKAVAAATTYYYVVQSVTGGVASANSPQASAVTTGVFVLANTTFVNDGADVVAGYDMIKTPLSWTPSAGGITTAGVNGFGGGVLAGVTAASSYLFGFLDLPHFFTSSARTLDMSNTSVGRPNVAQAAAVTTVTANLTGLAPWQVGWDNLEMVSFGAGVASYALDQFASLAPKDTTATVTLTLPVGTQMPDSTQGDLVYFVDLQGRSANGIAYQTATKGSSLSTNFATGQPSYTVSSALATPITTPTTNQRVDYLRSQFHTLAAQVNPAAQTFSGATPAYSDYLIIGVQPEFSLRGAFHSQGIPALVTVAPPRADADVDLGTISWQNPFPAGFDVVATYRSIFQLAYTTVPGASSPYYGTANIGGQDLISVVTLSGIKPLITPPQAPTIAAASAFADRTAVGLTPAIAWTAPVTGTAVSYSVTIYQFSVDGAGIAGATPVAILYTPAATLTVTVPSGVLVSGQNYYAVIRASTADYIAHAGGWNGPEQFAELLTNRFTP
jgi:fibronectin type 3 domain-containing protein